MEENTPILLRSSGNRAILFDAGLVPEKSTRTTQGVNVMTLKPNQTVTSALIPEGELLQTAETYRVKTLPAAGKLAKDLDDLDQMALV